MLVILLVIVVVIVIVLVIIIVLVIVLVFRKLLQTRKNTPPTLVGSGQGNFLPLGETTVNCFF